MALSIQQLQQILPNAGPKAGVFAPVLNAAMGRFGIVTPARQAAFIAQVGHESGQLRYVRELGSDKYLSKYDTGAVTSTCLSTTPARSRRDWATRRLLMATARSTGGVA